MPTNSIIFHEGPAPAEVIRIDAKGFHYRGQFIEDAGEAHRLLVEFLRKHYPEGNWQHADAEPEPVPVSERLPGPEDCDAEGRCWWWYPEVPGKTYGYWSHEDDAVPDRALDEQPSHWLPAHALPLPEKVTP